ncbi:hypothetical protein CULT_80020 [[Clostridium] ultunense Esp]|nr:hypothetical protein CULT_80020 [[Clostridium] ultunense Esp]
MNLSEIGMRSGYLAAIPGIRLTYKVGILAEFRVYYQKKFHEAPKDQHKRTIVLTERKHVLQIDVVLRNGQANTTRKKMS